MASCLPTMYYCRNNLAQIRWSPTSVEVSWARKGHDNIIPRRMWPVSEAPILTGAKARCWPTIFEMRRHRAYLRLATRESFQREKELRAEGAGRSVAP